MVPSKIFEKFKEKFPSETEKIDIWFPNGRNAIRVRFKSRSEVIFTYWSDKKWKLESLDHFLDSKGMGIEK